MGVEIIHTNSENVLKYGLCGYKDIKKAGYPEKLEWLKDHLAEGLKIKTLYSDGDGTQGMIEYIPGNACWRPVKADGYLFIHCIFVGFKSSYKNKGYGSLLLQECIKDAVKGNYHGVAVVTRQGPFMAGNELFLKNGFEFVDSAPPDFNLLVKKLNNKASSPRFKGNWEERLKRFSKGLTIFRAYQCPYTVKNVNDICEIAEKTCGIKPKIVTLASPEEAQDSPCAFGTFCIVFNGKVVACHPISGGRFKNIMQKEIHN